MTFRFRHQNGKQTSWTSFGSTIVLSFVGSEQGIRPAVDNRLTNDASAGPGALFVPGCCAMGRGFLVFWKFLDMRCMKTFFKETNKTSVLWSEPGMKTSRGPAIKFVEP